MTESLNFDHHAEFCLGKEFDHHAEFSLGKEFKLVETSTVKFKLNLMSSTPSSLDCYSSFVTQCKN